MASEHLVDMLGFWATEPEQRAILDAYLAEIAFPQGARVLEVGCGLGFVTRVLARWPGVAEAVGIDHTPGALARARQRSAGIPNLSFHEGDAHALTFGDASCDVVVFHLTLSSLADPARAITEAFRVLYPGGWIAVFDGDYTTATLQTGDFDPLQACVDALAAAFVPDRWLVRRLPALVRSAGFAVVRFRSHGYTEAVQPGYLLSIVDRGADVLVGSGRIGMALAAALKAEARRRAEAGEFFGHIAYVSLIARKPQVS